jgi:ribosomal protein L1
VNLFENPLTDEVEGAIQQAKELMENNKDLSEYKVLIGNLEKANSELRKSFLAIRSQMVSNLVDGAGGMDLSNITRGEQKLYKIFQEYLDIEFDEEEENEDG